MKLGEVFERKRWEVFNSYEDDGGEYMGDEDGTDTPEKGTVSSTEFEEDFE